MPRQSQRIQNKRTRHAPISSGAVPKRAKSSWVSNARASQPQVNRPPQENEFSEAMIGRLADVVTSHLNKQRNAATPASSSRDAHSQIVAEIPATVSASSTPVDSAEPQVALASHLGMLPCSSTSPNSGEPSDPFISLSLPIDARVSDKIRQKIWDNEYVDLGILLVRPANQNRFQILLGQPESGQQPSFLIEPSERPRRIMTIDQWLNAFHVYIGVYTAKYPKESPELIKYCS